MGFKMPGFSPFNKGQAYSPLTNTNNDGKENKDKKTTHYQVEKRTKTTIGTKNEKKDEGGAGQPTNIKPLKKSGKKSGKGRAGEDIIIKDDPNWVSAQRRPKTPEELGMRSKKGGKGRSKYEHYVWGDTKKSALPMTEDGKNIAQGFKDLGSTLTGGTPSKERQKQDAQKQAFMANWENMSPEERAKVPSVVRKTYGV